MYVTLSKMQVNHEKAVEDVRRKLYSWKHRFLSVFGKTTVIVSVVPNPNLSYLQQLETEFKRFISDNNPKVVDDTRLALFRRYIDSKSTWAKLPNTFNPISSNVGSLNKAKMQCKNQCWRELDSFLRTCRLNVLRKISRGSYIYPNKWQSLKKQNRIAIEEDWSKL